MADKQFQVFTGLTSSEQALGIAFTLPQTRDLYQDIIKDRGLDPETVDPLLVGSTLAVLNAQPFSIDCSLGYPH